MLQSSAHLLEVVALTEELQAKGLRRGQVGTVVEVLEPGSFEVEFSDNDGRTYAMLPLRAEQLIVIHHHHQPVEVSRP